MPTRCISDNYQVLVQAGGREHFEMALCLAFNGREAAYYAEYPNPFGLVFYWYVSTSNGDWTENIVLNVRDDDGLYEICDPISATKPPHSMCVGECLDIAWDWLQEQPKENYPLHGIWNDVIYEKGFEISTGDVWGHIGNQHGTICMIKPVWMWIGK